MEKLIVSHTRAQSITAWSGHLLYNLLIEGHISPSSLSRRALPYLTTASSNRHCAVFTLPIYCTNSEKKHNLKRFPSHFHLKRKMYIFLGVC